MDYDVIILGAGGAGLMAAIEAGRGGARVLVLDHAEKAGKKILISGGGRCNFTNLGIEPRCFLSENPHFAKSALSRYTQWDFLGLVEDHKIAWHEKTLGQLFCDGSARQIVAMLLAECEKVHAVVELKAEVAEIERRDGLFHVGGHSAHDLIIATGGPSIPKMGATGRAYEVARQFGLNVITPRPALVPLTLGGEDMLFRTISGISCPVVARAGGMQFAEAALFTHKGLSGPAILQISSYWTPGEPVELNVLPDAMCILKEARQNAPRARLKSVLAQHLPSRLAEALAEKIRMNKEMANLSNRDIDDVTNRLTRLVFHPSGTEGFAKAEVTAGGVDTAELSSKTMAAKKVPGLYFVGEAIDVTGWLGGYNFQWAWSSGVAAGQAVAQQKARRTGRELTK